MEKIPVGATIARAYSFAFGRFFTLLGIAWISWAILAVGGFFLMRQSMAFSAALTTRNFSSVGAALLVLIPFYIASLLLLLMQYMGFTEQALGLRTGSTYYYFKLGQPLWRLVLSILLAIVTIIAVIGFMAFAIGALSAATGGRGAGALALALASLVLYCAFIYVVVRLTFFIAPVAVAENRIGLKRAWALGKGNFWRMFVIILAVILPISIVMMVFMFTFMFQGLPLPPAGADPAQLAQYRAAVAAWQTALTGRLMSYWYITYPFYIVFTVVFYGLSAGAQAFAYRALRPEDPAAEFS